MHTLEAIETEARLDDLLSLPSPQAVQALRAAPGDILLLGAGGKMGPTLARMARRAADSEEDSRRIIAVSRYSKPSARAALEQWGVETISCDLLDEAAIQVLPDAPNVIYMTGMKFGTQGNAAMTWAMNAYLPALVCRRFPGSRIVAFSSGNVYPLMPVSSGGSIESDALTPLGEYANSVVARERMFEYFSGEHGTPAAILRLNYACELRYGVLVDLAVKVWEEQPVDLTMGYFNILWQGDANAMGLWALAQTASPPSVWNMTGPEILSVRAVAEEFGRMFEKQPRLAGEEASDALLNDAGRLLDAYGPPRVRAETLIRWIAAWIQQDGARLNKPTQFTVRDGLY
ncbi:MAG: NAD(P)-dependent oxidoreductase [Candidatus Hydrogenedentes bacterium]|nr:NAD(P)-dependent oxidoreductase [Candidatus Hydrogenedentota bacterium]